ncbi:hypothetical protein UCRPA7_1901 [Phaeoacremonium minimum UCRPA7]|uniref:Uncharacterized protein n=1 Tax=Phaeoacremonium minimum (strain UCR-PA7) TaxID=1286976 RepID=R8BT98_PHAM7|nr:hypothetical protein UCRPA7_1901 [Phaeoacremonium minimum UCRPA7]EOO02607.1 hypothetical protein UCRPA7_1901 [Phaeoacremonium minimum UCRPA7]
MRPTSRDTGFPEPFCGNRNTTLPHPDADLSPNASISADDISITRVLSRQRRSFLSSRNKRTISHGLITKEMEQMYSDPVIDSDLDSPTIPSGKRFEPLGRPSTSDGGDSMERPSTSNDESRDPAQLRVSTEHTHKRRHSLLGKFGFHHHK